MKATTSQVPELKNMASLARWMDARFTIPGTDIKFGLDALLGLFPGAGDFATLLVSGYMVNILAKNGASGFVLARMVLNILIDALIGLVPILGDIFDIAFRANMRNMKLMQEHYIEGRHQGGAWKVVVPLLLLTFIVIAGIAWLSYQLITWLISLF